MVDRIDRRNARPGEKNWRKKKRECEREAEETERDGKEEYALDDVESNKDIPEGRTLRAYVAWPSSRVKKRKICLYNESVSTQITRDEKRNTTTRRVESLTLKFYARHVRQRCRCRDALLVDLIRMEMHGRRGALAQYVT